MKYAFKEFSKQCFAKEADTKIKKNLTRLGIAPPAIACALALIAAVVIVHPVAEIPMGDDFSYITSTEILARTGHITYVGFSEPILGWQLYLGAAFIKMFGFSFTVVRSSLTLLAIITVFICYNTMVRCGIRPWNASIGTLTLVLSPLYVEQATAFQTDLAGFFAVILCLYGCIRSLQAAGAKYMLGWIAFAVFTNALFGTARQVAWLGFLTMVPVALWLLRKNRYVVPVGVTIYCFGIFLVGACFEWFQRQPYTQHESLLAGPLKWWVLHRIGTHVLRVALEVVFLAFPVVIVLFPALLRRKQPWQVYALGLVLGTGSVQLWRRHELAQWFAPFLATSYTWPLSDEMNIAVTLLVAVGLVASISFRLLFRKPWDKVTVRHPPSREKWSLQLLTMPFALAYLGLLLFRSGFEPLWDRYMLPLVWIFLILTVRLYQGETEKKLPVIALLVTIALGGYGVALSHDNFAYNRARLIALTNLRSKGIPATQITGGWDYDAMTELQVSGHVYGPHVLLPAGVIAPISTHYGIDHCVEFYCDMFPHVLPKYALSGTVDPEMTQFAPVPYRTWTRQSGSLFVVRFR